LSASRRPPLGVLLVEDDPRTRAHLAGAVRSHPAFRLLAEASTVADGRAALERQSPQVMLVDLGLPDGSGLDLIRAAAAKVPTPDVMVISAFGDQRNVLDGSPTDVADNILRLVAGEAPISPAIAAHLIRRLRPAPGSAPAGPPADESVALTEREMSVLQLVAKGLSYEEIGAVLQLRYNTVASYIKGIYRKLAVRSRGEAVFEARQMGLLE
jgi:DNA-binding NarL/FixJ family response regulator